MKFVIVYGSVRTGRVGINAVHFLKQQLEKRKHSVKIVDPKVHKLPLLNKMYKEYPKGKAPKTMQELATIFKAADGVMVVSAEYNHSIPPALSNILDHFMEEYFFKPSAIVTYSVGGFGGARVAMQLRSLLPEIGMPTIPSIFSISKVHEAFDKTGKDLTGSYEKRIHKFLDEFEWYAKAMKAQRKQGVPY